MTTTVAQAPHKQGRNWAHFFREVGWLNTAGLAGVVLITLVALLAQWITPYDPLLRVAESYLPPSLEHLFGTDEIGRDLFSRVVLGVQFTWLPGIGVIAVTLCFGGLLGLIAGALGGWVDTLIQRVIELFLVLPSTLIALAVVAALGPGLLNTMIAIGIFWWPWYARISRDEIRRLKARPHVEAARIAGVRGPRLILRYLLPGAIPALLVAATLDVANIILTMSLMSFLGLGQPAPAPELGAMSSRALDSLTVYWWLPIMPALVIFLMALLANLAGDGIRSALRGLEMVIYLGKRFVGLVAVLLVMSFIVFCLQAIIPTDPARAMAGPTAPLETVEKLRQQLGLNDPLLTQYGRFVGNLLSGELGTSIRTRQPIAADIRKYAPASVELGLVALIFGVAIASLLALLQSSSQRSEPVRLLVLAAGSMPIFLSALLLVYTFWFKLGWLPGVGRLYVRRFAGPTGLNLLDGFLVGRPEVSLDALSHLILPGFALALPIAIAVSRSLNGALVDVMKQSYIRTGRGKGLSETAVVLRHGLRNAASAPLAMIGLQVGLLFGNLLIVERIFAWPGLGLYTVQAFASSDLPAVLGVSMVFGAFYIVVNALVEIGQSLADPRIGL